MKKTLRILIALLLLAAMTLALCVSVAAAAEKKSPLFGDVCVELKDITSVSSVTLDGVKLLPGTYTVDRGTNTLIIRNVASYNNTLAVTGTNGKKLCVYTYTLSFNPITGFTAYPLYSTNNVVGTIATIAMKIISVGKTILARILG